MSPSPYRAALLRARKLAGSLEAGAGQNVARALKQYARAMEEILAQSGGRRATETRRILRTLAEEFARNLEGSIGQGRTMAFEAILEEWERGSYELARARGVSRSTLGAIRPGPVSMLGAYESIGGAPHWRTALQGHAGAAAAEANRIVRLALTEGVGAEELGRRLRKYVLGSEGWGELFEKVPTKTGDVWKLDLRKLPHDLRGAAARMRNNANRIAFSEIHNARAEAEVQHFIRDPFSEAVQWELSPFRGVSFTPPDECDILATQDLYGLGPGVYPVYAVPGPPHPYDRCERMPRTRPTSRLREGKPSPGLKRSPLRGPLRGIKGMADLTPARIRRMREQAASAVNMAERARKKLQRRAG